MIAGDLLGERARLTPEKTALIEVRSNRRFTYAELNRRAAAMAHFWTAKCGLAKGDRIGILSQNCVEYVDAFFAAGKSGIILVPLNTRLSGPELEAQLDDAAITTILVGSALPGCRRSSERSWLPLESVSAAEFTPTPTRPEDLWCLLYTSGTTGSPKGVMLPHRMILWNAYNTVASWQLREDDIAPIFTPMYHAGGLAVFLTPLFLIGGTIILHDRFDSSEIWRWTERERATVIFGVPTTFQMMREAPEFETADLSSVRWAISGGAPLSAWLAEQYRSRGLVFKQGYGLTEAGVNCFAISAEDAARRPASIGQPMLFSQVRLTENGEICLRGPHVFSGYWNQPKATAAALDPEGWLHTGDLGHCDEEGFYYIDGRLKDMYISGGANVYPAEVERVLLDHPAIQDAAVIGIPDPTWGEAGIAFVVPRPGQTPTEPDILGFLDCRLARYKLPRAIHFRDTLPRSAYGKVLKHELKA